MISALALLVAVTSPVHLRLGPQGEILGWLIAGPFPNVGALELKGKGYATDYLGGEGAASAVEGAEIRKVEAEQSADPKLIIARKPGWQLGVGDDKSGIDLDRLLNGSKPGIAYLYAELDSPREIDAAILFGSDDGAKVWVNGEQKFSKQIARGIKRDEDRVPIHLKPGKNRILFKVEQGNGGWGLLARVVDSSGQPAALTESLDVDPSVKSRGVLARVHAAAGKPGVLDIAALTRYDALHARASRWLSRFRAEAIDPDRLNEALAQGDDAMKGLDDATAESDRARAAGDRIQAAFDHARAKLVAEIQNPKPLFETQVSREDFVRVMPGGRYFVHASGKPFIPLGYNHNPDWTKLEEANPSREGEYDPNLPDRYLAHLHDCGVNVLRMMIETPPSGNLEDPIGTFQPEHVRWLDTVVAAARKHDIKLIVTPWDTFWMNLRWETTPYNPDRGGLVKERLDFITQPAIRAQQKRRLQFLIDRYGNSGTVFSWELLNEADLWWGANAAQLRSWSDDMSAYVRKYEKAKWGRNHLVSVSFAEAMPKGDMAKLAYTSPDFDYATTHLYIGASKAPTEPIGPAKAIDQGIRYAMGQIQDTRPYMDTENGPIDKWIDDAKLDEQVFHGMIWTHLAGGGAGSGFRWPYRNPHILTEGMLQELKKMSVFAAEVPWAKLAGPHLPFEAAGEGDAAVSAFATKDAAIAWTSGKTLHLHLPGATKYRIFDTTSGTWSGEQHVSDGEFSVSGNSPAILILRH